MHSCHAEARHTSIQRMNQPSGTSKHLVLARKWRPRDFESLVGQETVVKALRHALDSGRLHHAYLLTGTRGVGKTTIARIIAKSLNCETGVTSTPCGRCEACTGIDVGRYTDYVEMDAASNRKVEEMASVLESAAYAPAVGRYKVFVIDEVHMLTNHAFNAMLKTLEEPPPQVVFVLATTDPHKVPVTVLSRCMQFGLRNMSPDAVSDHLAKVLTAEGVAFEPEALRLIGRASAGSMRDGLSLLDQAIAVGAGAVAAAEVREMLGVVDDSLVTTLLDLLAEALGEAYEPALEPGTGVEGRGATAEVIALADRMASENAPFGQVLMSMAGHLQRIAVLQLRLGRGAVAADMPSLATRLDPADVQAWYQILIHGARDLALAPDNHSGFVMTLVRLVAFTAAGPQPASAPVVRAGAPVETATGPGSEVGRKQVGRKLEHEVGRDDGDGARREAVLEPGRGAGRGAGRPVAREDVGEARLAHAPLARQARKRVAEGGSDGVASDVEFDGDWAALAASVQAGGMDRQLLQLSELVSRVGPVFRLRVPLVQFAQPQIVARVTEALSRRLGVAVKIEVEVGKTGSATAAVNATRAREARQAEAQVAIEDDPFVRELIDDFGATIVPDSIKPVDGATPT